MRLSRQSLESEASATGFHPEALEKVFLLLDLLEAINEHPDLSGKLALKGGTALLPLLRANVIEAFGQPSATWGKRLANECRVALAAVLPLRENELRFLNRLLADGELEPEHLTSDAEIASRIRRHPALLWKRLNVRKHFHLDG